MRPCPARMPACLPSLCHTLVNHHYCLPAAPAPTRLTALYYYLPGCAALSLPVLPSPLCASRLRAHPLRTSPLLPLRLPPSPLQTAIVSEGFRSLREGEPVEFFVETSDDGRQKAVNVTGPNGAAPEGAPRRQFDDSYGGGGGGGGSYGGGYVGAGCSPYGCWGWDGMGCTVWQRARCAAASECMARGWPCCGAAGAPARGSGSEWVPRASLLP